MADYRPSDEVEADLKDKERDRFVTYMDATGQLVNRPVDLVAAKEAKENAGPGYQTVAQDQYLETYREIRSDCCKHLIDDAIALHLNRQRSIHFGDESALMVGDEPYRAVLLAPDEGVSAIDVRAYLKNKGYVAAQILWLDSSGTPVLLVDQPFTRRYEENWYRYGYLEGTLPRQQGQTYLVVFLPYTQDHPSTDGLTATLSGDLVVTGVANE
ncbi:hypothetical protein A11A3_16822 [Alcanivorax hongdengensis A-11-3]|uniref:Uncharacterized protein n=2 Tax=Alcanivorax hongdengensis TaxID=519051 RepID=L0W7W5_9GAMM|nr:hypothetical protein A11A3_16822 [Alcanivorax hongdengensis A-11-3]